jgi:hypothetical protein
VALGWSGHRCSIPNGLYSARLSRRVVAP